jgi:hypothetical protein
MISINITGDTPVQEVQEFAAMFSARNIYDDVAKLQADVADLRERTADSGWRDLQLKEGITAYSSDQRPVYRRIGEIVFLAGVFKGVTAINLDIATLPDGFRPARKVILPFAGIGQKINRMEILTDGTIRYSRSSIEPTTPENWHSIACCFSTVI